VDLLSRVLAFTEVSTRDVSEEWDPRWHVGAIEDRTRAERSRAIAWLHEWREELDWLADRLADEASRETLMRVLAHRVAGSRRVVLGVGRQVSEQLTDFAASSLTAAPVAGDEFPAFPRYRLDAIGLDLRVISAPMFAIGTFVLEQYRHPQIESANVRSGDVVIDGGAFWGDTALWFADQIGASGRVIAFEPDPVNRSVLEANLRANAEHGSRVEIRAEALWDSALPLHLTPQGGGSTVAPAPEGDVRGVSLDELRRRGELPRVDFLKLDVEGAELNVLRGARDLIRETPPRLAVAVYHRPDDVVTIPRLLGDLVPTYRFAITHQSFHQYDTMLFAWTEA
jgi:FkbM family methyltransferase